MTFERPDLLLLGPTLALLLSLALAQQWRRLGRLARSLGVRGALRLVPRGVQRFPTGRMLFLALASFALACAAAGPRPAAPEPLAPLRALDIAVVVDVSRSMSATDVEPSRIGRARQVVDRLAEALPSARIVLILFADWPYTLVPPTDDPAVVRYFAHSLSADLVLDRDQGTSLSSAIAHAREALAGRPRPEAAKAILVLSDGGAHDDRTGVVRAASEASLAGIRVWTAGLGTRDGVPIATQAGPVLDAAGRPVVAALEEESLRDAAQAGGGQYHDVSTDAGLGALMSGLTRADGGTDGGEEAPLDIVFWLTLTALPLLLLESGLDAGRRLRGPGRPHWDT